MNSFESVTIPGERLAPIARETASSSKTVAGVLGFVFVVFAIAMLSMIFEDKGDKAPTDSAERAGYMVGKVLSVFLIAGLPGLFAVRAGRRASRATRAAEVAIKDPGVTWRLVGKLIVAERSGVPEPDITFNISGRSRAMLLAVPRADVISSS